MTRPFAHVRGTAGRRLPVGWHAGARGLAYVVLSSMTVAGEEPDDGYTFLHVLAMMARPVILLLAVLGTVLPEVEGA